MNVSIVVYMFIGSITIGSDHKIDISDDEIKKDFTSNPPIYTLVKAKEINNNFHWHNKNTYKTFMLYIENHRIQNRLSRIEKLQDV